VGGPFDHPPRYLFQRLKARWSPARLNNGG
jgi:hypothetical protein